MCSTHTCTDMGNIFKKKPTQVKLLSFKQRYTDSERSSSTRSKLRTSYSRTSIAELSPFPTDIAIVTHEGVRVLLVLDYMNRTLKTFSPRENREICMENTPYRMATLHNAVVAVTCPLSHEIKLICVSSLTVDRVISTVKMYSGIATLHNDKHVLVVSSHRVEPGFVDLIDLDGRTLKSFVEDPFGNSLFVTPSFLSTTSNGDILISDYTMHSLTCITTRGEVRWRHQPHKGEDFLEDPVGVVYCDSEHIFLVDRLKKCVFRFTSRGFCFGAIIEIPDDMCEPFSICTDNQRTIYIGFDDGNIHVYPDSQHQTVKTHIELPWVR